ncbi:MAG: hypothetical protein GC137_02985 [Alphaproteobacteria bacterium]|nr:hypothetical protein [Alphaproteobacteria bacterium]
MATLITAQCIGLFGYIICISAPHVKDRTRILRANFWACAFMCIQWYLLDQYSLLTMNALGLFVSYIAMCDRNLKDIKLLRKATYPLGTMIILLACSGTLIDVLAIAAFWLLTLSRYSQTVRDLCTYATAAGIILTVSGSLALSVIAVIFNAAFALSHVIRLLEERRHSHAQAMPV